jgi:hypothetical protein
MSPSAHFVVGLCMAWDGEAGKGEVIGRCDACATNCIDRGSHQMDREFTTRILPQAPPLDFVRAKLSLLQTHVALFERRVVNSRSIWLGANTNSPADKSIGKIQR